MPTSVNDLMRPPNDKRDCWTVWADFRKLCSNFSSQKLIGELTGDFYGRFFGAIFFSAGLHLLADIDDEFVDKKLISRWKAEPVTSSI